MLATKYGPAHLPLFDSKDKAKLPLISAATQIDNYRKLEAIQVLYEGQEVGDLLKKLLESVRDLMQQKKIVLSEAEQALQLTYNLFDETQKAATPQAKKECVERYQVVALKMQGTPSLGMKILGSVLFCLGLAILTLALTPVTAAVPAILGSGVGIMGLCFFADGFRRKDLSKATTNIATWRSNHLDDQIISDDESTPSPKDPDGKASSLAM